MSNQRTSMGSGRRPGEASVSVLDHGLLYGDGVFEGIRVYDGRPFLMDEHLDRLEASARAIVLELPAGREEIAAVSARPSRRYEHTDGYCAWSSRAAWARSASRRTPAARPSLIVISAPLSLYPPERYRDGVRLDHLQPAPEREATLSPRRSRASIT